MYMCYEVNLSPFPPPDVQVDTSGRGACSRSPCGCACPNLVKVCWLEKRSFTQRTGVPLSPLLYPSCPVCQRCWQWDTLDSAVHGAALVLISCFLCFPLSFSFFAPLSIAFLFSLFCSFFLSLFSFLWFCFLPLGVQMTLLAIAVKPTLWPVSTVCPFLLLSVSAACWSCCVMSSLLLCNGGCSATCSNRRNQLCYPIQWPIDPPCITFYWWISHLKNETFISLVNSIYHTHGT